MENYKVIHVGTGEIGKPLYELFNGCYKTLPIDAVYYPVDPNKEMKCHLLNICIPGELKNFNKIVKGYVDKYDPNIILIHSTLVPGTTDKLAQELGIGKTNTRILAHTPVHGKHQGNQMKMDMLRYPKYVGLVDNTPENQEHVREILAKVGFFIIKFHANPLTTEWSKVLATTEFGLQIAFVQEVERICDKHGLKYEEVADILPIQENIRGSYIFPGFIGGHCVMPNIKIIKSIHNSDLLDWIEWSNEKKKKRDGTEVDERGR